MANSDETKFEQVYYCSQCLKRFSIKTDAGTMAQAVTLAAATRTHQCSDTETGVGNFIGVKFGKKP